MRASRVYVDTSVFGGCLDEEFATDSQRLFEEIRQGLHVLLVSDVVVRELQNAPPDVQSILLGLPPKEVITHGPDANEEDV